MRVNPPPRSRYLSWLLRHGATDQGLAIDEAGWASVVDVLKLAEISRADLTSVVESDRKHRFELEEDRIRACQGHSLDSGVTRQALEASWSLYRGDASIWHGTALGALKSISREGLLPGKRTHVHCASDPHSNVGRRTGIDVLLELSALRLRVASLGIYVASNGVVLVRHIPWQAVVGFVTVTRAARDHEDGLRSMLLHPITR